jgi:hypothetical protein
MYLRTCGSFESANHKKDSVPRSQIRKVSHVRKVRIHYKLFMSANLLICDRGTYLRTAHSRLPRFYFYFLRFGISPRGECGQLFIHFYTNILDS